MTENSIFINRDNTQIIKHFIFWGWRITPRGALYTKVTPGDGWGSYGVQEIDLGFAVCMGSVLSLCMISLNLMFYFKIKCLK